MKDTLIAAVKVAFKASKASFIVAGKAFVIAFLGALGASAGLATPVIEYVLKALGN